MSGFLIIGGIAVALALLARDVLATKLIHDQEQLINIYRAQNGEPPLPKANTGWWHRWLTNPQRPWSGSTRRCGHWQLGPFYTDWRCLLVHDHEQIERTEHLYEPDIWLAGDEHDEFMARWQAVRPINRGAKS